MSRFVILCRVLLISFVASSFLAESAWATIREVIFRLGRESAEKEYLVRNQDLLLETESKISKKDAEIDSLNQQLENLKRQNEGLEAEKNERERFMPLAPIDPPNDVVFLSQMIVRLGAAGVNVMDPMVMIRVMVSARDHGFDATTPDSVEHVQLTDISRKIIFSDPDMMQLRDQHRVLLTKCITQLQDFIEDSH